MLCDLFQIPSWLLIFSLILSGIHLQEPHQVSSEKSVSQMNIPKLNQGAELQLNSQQDWTSTKKKRQRKVTVYYKGPTKYKRVALTFDDGPDSHYTVKILDILKREQVPATFFVLGKLCKRNPHVLQRMVREGHCIGNHSWDHPDFTDVSAIEMMSQLKRTNEIIRRITGKTPVLVRPPFGTMNQNVKREIAKYGFTIIHWSLDTKDWRGTSAQKILQTVQKKIGPGDIILQHSAGGIAHLDGTVKALPEIIHLLKKEGYEIVTIEQLLHTSAYKSN
jgi:delta-lactam-biosynthetic de-N-acetylase